MNIIELFENSGIYKEDLRQFTFEDTVKAKKQFEIETSTDRNLVGNFDTDLILAMNEFPKELLFIVNNRVLYNLFAKKNYSRNRFNANNAVSVPDEAIKAFVSRFLTADLGLFIEKKMDENNFETIGDILVVKEFFPQQSLDLINQKISEKFDFIFNTISVNLSSTDANQSISFIKYWTFYALVSNFRSVDNDLKIKSLHEKITNHLLRADFKENFVPSAVISMGSYNAIDPLLNSKLRISKELFESKADAEVARSGDSGGMSVWGIITIIAIVLRVILMIARMSR